MDKSDYIIIEIILFAVFHFIFFSATNLGLLYESIGEFGKAEQYYKHALQSRQVKLGRDNPSTLTS